MAAKLTVLIPCKNERRNIRPCIESVQAIADELLIADSGSTDGTLDIVREMFESFGRMPDHRARIRQLGRLQELGDSAGQARMGAGGRRGRTRASRSWPTRSAGARQSAGGDRRLLDRPRQPLPGLPHPPLRLEHGRRAAALSPRRGSLSDALGPRGSRDWTTAARGGCDTAFLHYTTWNTDDYLFKMNRYAAWGALNFRDEKGTQDSRLPADDHAGPAAILAAVLPATRLPRRHSGPAGLHVHGVLFVPEAGQAVGDAQRDSAARSGNGSAAIERYAPRRSTSRRRSGRVKRRSRKPSACAVRPRTEASLMKQRLCYLTAGRAIRGSLNSACATGRSASTWSRPDFATWALCESERSGGAARRAASAAGKASRASAASRSACGRTTRTCCCSTAARRRVCGDSAMSGTRSSSPVRLRNGPLAVVDDAVLAGAVSARAAGLAADRARRQDAAGFRSAFAGRSRTPRRADSSRTRWGLQGSLDSCRRPDCGMPCCVGSNELPHVAAGEDLDLLVDDESLAAVRELLESGPGIQAVDLYSVCGAPGADYQKLPYYPPYLAEQLLERAVGSRRPVRCAVAARSFFEPGVSCGLSQRRPRPDLPASANAKPAVARARARLRRRSWTGWRGSSASRCRSRSPTWTRISTRKAGGRRTTCWSGSRARTNGCGRSSRKATLDPTDAGLAVFLVRREALARGGAKRAAKLIAEHGFQIVETIRSTPQRLETIARSIRGGNWGQGPWPKSGGEPVAAIVAFDPAPIRPSRRERRKFPCLANARLLTKDRDPRRLQRQPPGERALQRDPFERQRPRGAGLSADHRARAGRRDPGPRSNSNQPLARAA